MAEQAISMKIIAIPRVTVQPADEDVCQLCSYFITYLSTNGHGLLEAEYGGTDWSTAIPWRYRRTSGTGPSRCNTWEPQPVALLAPGYFRACLARFGYLCIGDTGMYGGSDAFQVHYQGDEKPTDQFFWLYMANMGATGFWIRLYRYR